MVEETFTEVDIGLEPRSDIPGTLSQKFGGYFFIIMKIPKQVITKIFLSI